MAALEPLQQGLLVVEGRVLVVDDDIFIAKLMRLMVEALGYGGESVHDGTEAVEACRRFAPMTILMDCQMRRMDGLEATRRIRALQRTGDLPPCRIVMITGSLEPSTRSAAFEAGVDAFLTKPVSIEQLQEQLAGRATRS
jgi:CheY-like chemotaxis protein